MYTICHKVAIGIPPLVLSLATSIGNIRILTHTSVSPSTCEVCELRGLMYSTTYRYHFRKPRSILIFLVLEVNEDINVRCHNGNEHDCCDNTQHHIHHFLAMGVECSMAFQEQTRHSSYCVGSRMSCATSHAHHTTNANSKSPKFPGVHPRRYPPLLLPISTRDLRARNDHCLLVARSTVHWCSMIKIGVFDT